MSMDAADINAMRDSASGFLPKSYFRAEFGAISALVCALGNCRSDLRRALRFPL
jgi:hypothetical protein